MDDDWERERRIAALKKPKHLGEGLQQGFMGLGEGVFKGVTGSSFFLTNYFLLLILISLSF